MTGLEKIIEQIRADSEAICKKITDSAKAEAKEIAENAVQTAAKACEQEKLQTEQRCEDIIERAKSAAALERRRALLEAKQELIAEMLENTRRSILNSDDESYFSLLLSMFKKYSSDSDCEIAFNARDIDRLPRDFISKAKKGFSSELKLCKTPADIDGGFLLLYGDIEENCSFSAIFSGESEHLSDIASELLFKD